MQRLVMVQLFLLQESSDSNIDINITPKGTGDVVLAADTVTVGDSGSSGNSNVLSGAGTLTVTTGGTTDLILSTNNGTALRNIYNN